MATRTKEEAGSRHRALGLTDDDLLAMYRTMVMARLCDEAQFRLNRQGKAPFVVPVSGHEGCQIGTAWAFERDKDVFVPYYRDMGVCLTVGMTPRDVFLGVFGKADDPSSGGRQMPAHWGSKEHHIISGSSPIATQIPHAAGAAYAIKYRGEDGVVGCWFGDGATSEGDWHEGVNFATIHKLPVVFYCENNRYAISVPLDKQMAVKDVADKASGYGMEGVVVEGNDVLACYEASQKAVAKARAGGGPTLVELKTYRFHPHTSDDDDRTYRSREEVDEAKRNDSLILFAAYLKEQGLLDDEKIEQIRVETKAEVDKEVEDAWNAADPEPETAMLHLFADVEVTTPAPEATTDGGAAALADDTLETTGGEATPSEPPAGGGPGSNGEAGR